MRRPRSLLLLLPLLLAPSAPRPADAFCGFYVASGDAKLYNRASQVVMVRDGDRTVLTMGSDYRGELSKFALVVPVPTVLAREQVHIGDQAVIDHLDAFSAPRLVEYFDDDPCAVADRRMMLKSGARAPATQEGSARDESGVRIEARYTVGEYDILILSADQSAGLQRWLQSNGYRVPRAATRVLDSYLKQGMKFFVARVNLEEQRKTGFQNLRPLQMAFESPRFMLPLRLGMVNADGPQDLLVYAITRTGRVECTNYRTVRLPEASEVPAYVKGAGPAFFKAMFDEQVRRADMSAVFLEHAWDMGWCDPCASPPLSNEELRQAGVFWLGDGGGGSAFLTRLHVRYDAAHFPEDLVFQQTSDRSSFQARFIMRHEWQGDHVCDAAKSYRASLPKRRLEQAATLVALTGWSAEDVGARMGIDAAGRRPEDIRFAATAARPWWENLWSKSPER